MDISTPDCVKYVRSVGPYGSKCKDSLKVRFGGANCDRCGSTNTLYRVERIPNGRTLTANSHDPKDLEQLTPSYLSMQIEIICLRPGVFEKTDIYRKKWRQVQVLANWFWEMWLKEYISTFQQRGK